MKIHELLVSKMLNKVSHHSRVVVTGMGMVTPIGVGVNENWSNLLAGKSGISKITDNIPELKGCKSQIGGQLPKHFNFKEHETSVRNLNY